MWISPDAHPYLPQVDAGRVGFFFAVTGIPEMEVQANRTLKFHFKNFCAKTRLLSSGHLPVYLEVSSQEYEDLITGALPFYR